MKNTGTFSSLDPKAEIFEELKKQRPAWWDLLCKDEDIYIEIRKDNYINAYYLGGAVAKIWYDNGFRGEAHQKYLGDSKNRGKTKKGYDKFEYDPIDLASLSSNQLFDIKKHIEMDYLRKKKDSEKRIQGQMIKQNPNYIDSEFQFNKDPEIDDLRIDLIELFGGILSFIELKVISDNRLRNGEKRKDIDPEIIRQMRTYQLFINKYEKEIEDYYKNLLKIKKGLKLINTEETDFSLNKTPKLLIVDTYDKRTKGRDTRIADIKKVLDVNDIDYKIII